MSTIPCSTCPWRIDSEGGSAIPNFSIEKARHDLAKTVGHDDEFRPIMACHRLEGEETPCIGYVAIEGWSNLSVRLQAINGRIDYAAIMDSTQGIELHSSFDEMLGALEQKELDHG